MVPTVPMPVGAFEHLPDRGALDPTCAAAGAYGGMLTTYCGGGDTSGRARYDISRTLSVPEHAGWFDIHCHVGDVDGTPTPLAAVLKPVLADGEYALLGGRMWCDLAVTGEPENFGLAVLLFPHRGRWPDDGEIDVVEAALTSTAVGGAFHHADPAGTTDVLRRPGVRLADRVQALVEWRPPRPDRGDPGSVRILTAVAGGPYRLLHQTRTAVPRVPMAFLLQSGSHTPGTHGEGHLRVYGMKVWAWDPAQPEPPWTTTHFPFDAGLSPGRQHNGTGVVASGLRFRVTIPGAFTGLLWEHPGREPRTVLAQLWLGGTLLVQESVTVSPGRNVLHLSGALLHPGATYQVQVVQTDGTADFTALPDAFDLPVTAGPVTTAGIESPGRYGTATDRPAAEPGRAWRGIGPIVETV
ncbi:hypothetical protein JL107_07285 [Nakamurella flavida]|uniref:Uncharacterized protein n=1 Tax=Nakamurella flavida TaxID=363630 RepID=A0A938YEK8_9ACTN|nr:hypothetical protein [Nakamurella flavida]MBM9476240.1 hypothetical protein [Nakamurella flavida]MDP9779662.1 hypothetical protein [Nakamurella flavida]